MRAIDSEMNSYAENLMKRFKLVDMRIHRSDIIAEAENKNLSYLEFLVRLLLTE